MRHVLLQGGPIGLVHFFILGHLFTLSGEGGKNICIPPILHLWNSTIIHLLNLRFGEHQHLNSGAKKRNETEEGCHSLQCWLTLSCPIASRSNPLFNSMTQNKCHMTPVHFYVSAVTIKSTHHKFRIAYLKHHCVAFRSLFFALKEKKRKNIALSSRSISLLWVVALRFPLYNWRKHSLWF